MPATSRPSTTPTNKMLSVSPKHITPKHVLGSRNMNVDTSPHMNRIASTKTFEKENMTLTPKQQTKKVFEHPQPIIEEKE